MGQLKDNIKEMGLCVTFSPLFAHIFKIEDLEYELREISKIGYKRIELSIRDLSDIDWNNFNSELKKNNLELICLSTGLVRKIDNISLMDKHEVLRKEAINRVKKMINHIANYDGSQKRILIGFLKGTLSEDRSIASKQLSRLRNSLLEILETAEKKKVLLVIEVLNQNESSFINSISEGVEFVSDLKSDYIKLIIDSYHMSFDTKDFSLEIKRAKDYISYVHLSDTNRFFPGSGDFDFTRMFKTLDEINYKGYFSMEFNPAKDKLISIKKGYDYISKVSKKNL